MIKTTMEIIKRTIQKVKADFYCEIEYYGEDGIDIRIFDDGFVPVSEMVLHTLSVNGIFKNQDTSTVDIPSKEEIKYGFCGVKFERIWVELPPELINENYNRLINFDVEMD